MRALLIVNPHATSITDAGRKLVARALSGTVELQIVETERRGHARELAESARHDGLDAIIVHGGDGTVSEVINGLIAADPGLAAEQLPAVAVIPGGNANVFARSLGIHRDPLASAVQILELLAAKQFRIIGLGEAHFDGVELDESWTNRERRRLFLFNAGVGVDAEVVRRMESQRAKGHAATTARYLNTTVWAFLAAGRRSPCLTVAVDAGEPVAGYHFAFVSNASPWTYMNARPIVTNPGTNYETTLGVFASQSMSLTRNLGLIGQLLSTRNARGKGPRARHLLRNDAAHEISVTASTPTPLQLDGDLVGDCTAVRFTHSPNRIKVIAPAPEK